MSARGRWRTGGKAAWSGEAAKGTRRGRKPPPTPKARSSRARCPPADAADAPEDLGVALGSSHVQCGGPRAGLPGVLDLPAVEPLPRVLQHPLLLLLPRLLQVDPCRATGSRGVTPPLPPQARGACGCQAGRWPPHLQGGRPRRRARNTVRGQVRWGPHPKPLSLLRTRGPGTVLYCDLCSERPPRPRTCPSEERTGARAQGAGGEDTDGHRACPGRRRNSKQPALPGSGLEAALRKERPAPAALAQRPARVCEGQGGSLSGFGQRPAQGRGQSGPSSQSTPGRPLPPHPRVSATVGEGGQEPPRVLWPSCRLPCCPGGAPLAEVTLLLHVLQKKVLHGGLFREVGGHLTLAVDDAHAGSVVKEVPARPEATRPVTPTHLHARTRDPMPSEARPGNEAPVCREIFLKSRRQRGQRSRPGLLTSRPVRLVTRPGHCGAGESPSNAEAEKLLQSDFSPTPSQQPRTVPCKPEGPPFRHCGLCFSFTFLKMLLSYF